MNNNETKKTDYKILISIDFDTKFYNLPKHSLYILI